MSFAAPLPIRKMGEWMHVAASFSSTDIVLSINGVQVYTAVGVTIVAPTGQFASFHLALLDMT